MSEQRQGRHYETGHGQYRCTGRVGRGIQIGAGSGRGAGTSRQHFDRNGGRRGDRTRDDDYKRNWPESGVEPEKRASLESEVESLRNQIAKINIDSSINFASKLSPGTNGRSLSLLTNYFALKVSQSLTVHQYEVNIESLDSGGCDTHDYVESPKKVCSKYRRLIVEQLIKTNEQVFNGNITIYDCHRSLYSKVKFDFESFDVSNNCVEFKVAAKEFPDEPSAVFIVKISYIGHFEVGMNSSVYSKSVVNFIDLVLRYGPATNNRAFENIIFYSQKRLNASVGTESAIGFSQKVYNCECGLLLNVDRAVILFHTARPVINFFRDRIQGFEKMTSLPEDKVQRVCEDLRGLFVKVSMSNYSKKVRVSGVTMDPAFKLVCKYEKRTEDGKVISSDEMPVVDYFESNSQRIRYPHFPCLVSGDEYYPLEVCELLGDQKVKDDDLIGEQATKILQEKTYKRFNEINNAIKAIRTDGERYNKEFGLSLCPYNVQVTGRVLDAPSLKVANDENITPDNNRCWNIQRPNTVFEGIHITKWIVVYISKDRWKMLDDEFNAQFAQKLIEVSQTVGVPMEKPLRIFTHDFVNVDNLKKDVFEQFENLQLIVFIIARKDNLYNLLKKLAIFDYGIPTQCVSADNFSSSIRDNKLLHYFYLRNVSLQINSKLNGINWMLDVEWTSSMKRVMFVGIDVKLVARSASFSPSIVSCVGTVDDMFVRYGKFVSIQDVTARKIVDVKGAIKCLLQSYKLKNNIFPDSVIVYRKAAFDCSFPDVLTSEVSALKNVLLEMGCEAKTSYICIQERTDFRMLPVNPEDATSALTIPAGVVVDTVVTNPALHSFFLSSNIDFKGTSTPPYYTLLFDENNLTADKLQQITHDLCFLHPFSSRAATFPIPVELAKSCLDRARERIGDLMGNTSYISISSPEAREEYTQKLTEALIVHENIDKFLYYV